MNPSTGAESNRCCLPNDQLEKVAALIKAKIDVDKVGDVLEGMGGLFGKK